jgi:hypothetical protein
VPLSDQETTALEIVARYNFLTECQEKGYISKEKYKEIVFGFGPKNLEMINYYTKCLDEHFKETSEYMDRLKPGEMPDTIEGLADKIVEDLSPEDRDNLSRLPEELLKPIQMASGLYSKEQLDNIPDDKDVQGPSDAFGPAKVVKRVWQKLRGND